MNKAQTILFFIGLSFLTIGYFIRYDEKKRKKKCIFKIRGKVIKHSTGFIPHFIVEYSVGSKTYAIKNAYRTIHLVPVFFAKHILNGIHLDQANGLHIALGAKIDREGFLKRIAPLHQMINVYYNDTDPETAFVKEVPAYDSMAVRGCIYLGLIFAIIAWISGFIG